jgi:hypothetical protein
MFMGSAVDEGFPERVRLVAAFSNACLRDLSVRRELFFFETL